MTEIAHTFTTGQLVITPDGPGNITAIDGDDITVRVNGHTKNIPQGLRRPASRTRYHARELTELPDWHTGDRFRSSGIGTGTILRLGTDHVYVKRDDGREQWLPLTLLSPIEEEDTDMNNHPFDNRNPIDPQAFANSADLLNPWGATIDQDGDDSPPLTGEMPQAEGVHHEPDGTSEFMVENQMGLEPGQDWWLQSLIGRRVEYIAPQVLNDDGEIQENVALYGEIADIFLFDDDIETLSIQLDGRNYRVQRSLHEITLLPRGATSVASDDPAADPYPVNMGASPDDDRDDAASLEERIDHHLRALVTKAHKKPYAGQLDDIREGVTRLGDLLMSRALGEEDDEPEEAPDLGTYHEMADKIIALQHSVEEFKAERDLLIRERNRLREESKALGAALDRIDELEAENATPSAVPEEAATTIKSFSQVWDISPDHLISRADEEIQINLANGWHVVHEQIIVDKNGTTRRYVRFEREVPTTPDTPEDSERAGDFDEVEGAEYVEDWAGMVREPDAIIGIDEPEPNGAKELTFHSPPSTGETPGETQRSIFGAALNMKHLTADEITRAGDLEAQAIASLTYTNEQRRLQHVGPALAALDERLKRNAR